MKILIDARLYGIENSGLGRYLIGLIDGLQNYDNKNNYVVLLRKKYFDSLFLNDNFKKVLLDIRHYSLAEQIFLPYIISKERPDLVHFPHFNIPFFYFGKFVVTIHDLLMHKQKGKESTTLPFVKYFLKRLFYKVVFSAAVSRSEKIIVPSNYVKSEMLKFYKINTKKIHVVYEGISELKNEERLIENEVLSKYRLTKNEYLFYVGNAYPHKNLLRLIQAVKIVNIKKRVLLAIATSRSIFSKRLLKYIKKEGLENLIKVIELPSDSELGILYKNSLAHIFPSLSEGFGLPGLEAMQNGTVCLASDIPIFKEIYQNNALYFNPLEVSDIVKVITFYLNLSDKEKKDLKRKSNNFVKRYSWDKMTGEIIKIYESCTCI